MDLCVETVEEHYRMMRQFQTVEYVQRMREKWLTFDKAEMTVWEAFEALKDYVDSSDPDTTLPNLEHMLQTGESENELDIFIKKTKKKQAGVKQIERATAIKLVILFVIDSRRSKKRWSTRLDATRWLAS